MKPFEATYLDLSYEWYFEEDSLAALAVFHKDVNTYIGVDIDEFEINGTPARISRPINGSGGRITGFELTLQTPLSVVHESLRDVGVNLNYAYLDTNIREKTPADNPLPLNGLARDNLSATLWYTRNKFEARASYSYRSDATALIRGSLQTLEGAEHLDVTLSYNILENVQVRAELGNLTNEALRAHFDNNPATLGRYRQYGRRYSIGLNYTFD